MLAKLLPAIKEYITGTVSGINGMGEDLTTFWVNLRKIVTGLILSDDLQLLFDITSTEDLHDAASSLSMLTCSSSKEPIVAAVADAIKQYAPEATRPG